MEEQQKTNALRMIPYGLFVLTAQGDDNDIASGTVTWVTQSSFKPPLVVVAVKNHSHPYAVIKKSQAFALNILGKEQEEIARKFFKEVERIENTIGGEPFRSGKSGSPLLENAIAYLDCKLVVAVEKGDHAVFIGEVIDAAVSKFLAARPDDEVLWVKDLKGNIFYGG